METKKYLFDGRIYLSEVEGVNDNPPGIKTCEDFEGNIGSYAIGLVEVKPSEFYYQKNRWLMKKIDDQTKDILKTMDYLKAGLDKDLSDIILNHRKSLGGV